ncbi:hypothetical protein AK812_SmicGene8548 [Symbiodinium microadriaticum]|uniref:Uncharacterized protein n=1 Tax=Symbiodinium microadriaticum TaxID=2951 RepID=A0A1Q9EKK5_SYMMI|nr:hypothetical protein AK812_SmicGene8548 [Symbiodinium microadriaticum]
MLPLGLIYAVGELLTLRSVQKASGPVYVVIANMKLVVAAVMSRFFFGRSRALPLLHWLELVFISLLAACYTMAEAGSMGSQWRWEGAWSALAKSSLVAFSSVFCEHIYKSNSFLVVLALQAFWGLATMVTMISAAELGFLPSVDATLRDDSGTWSLFSGGPNHPTCDSAEHAECLRTLAVSRMYRRAGPELPLRRSTSPYEERAVPVVLHGDGVLITAIGWDGNTFLAVFADLSNAVSSALVFRKLSAVAKYVCRASSAVPMYIFYCMVGRSEWNTTVFGIVLRSPWH